MQKQILGAQALAQTKLENTIAERTSELHHSYIKMENMARNQERILERERIMRDLHDGTGAHLSSAIFMLEKPEFDRNVLLSALHDAYDQLKISIDAINIEVGDLASLLANFRYRMEPRLRHPK